MNEAEAEWMYDQGPEALIDCLGDTASERKLILFAAACCRNIWGLVPHEDSRAAAVVAERRADGRASKKALRAARKAARLVLRSLNRKSGEWAAARACLFAAQDWRFP